MAGAGADARAPRAARGRARARWPRGEDGRGAPRSSAIVPAEDDERLGPRRGRRSRASSSDGLPGFTVTIGRSRRAADPVDLYRAGNEARLAVNVGEAEGRALLAFEDTGAYRLLLPAMSEDPGELERFYAETVEPLVAYDEQYETELVATVEAYLDNDGNVAATAKQLFTHRHTIRYRLERVQGALRPRRLLDRGAREARPRPEGDARARHRLPARPGDGAGRRGGQGARGRAEE